MGEAALPYPKPMAIQRAPSRSRPPNPPPPQPAGRSPHSPTRTGARCSLGLAAARTVGGVLLSTVTPRRRAAEASRRGSFTRGAFSASSLSYTLYRCGIGVAPPHTSRFLHSPVSKPTEICLDGLNKHVTFVYCSFLSLCIVR